jgi:hypothetical protein
MTKKKREPIKELKIWFKGNELPTSFYVDSTEDLFDLIRDGFSEGYFYFLDESESSVIINIDDVSVVKYEDD